MSSAKITFKISKDEQGRTVRTHVATGLRVITTKTDRGTEFVFYAPVKQGEREVAGYWGEATTMSEMRWMAEGRVAELLVNIEIDHSDAITENAERAIAKHCPEIAPVAPKADDLDHARKQFPSVFAMLDEPTAPRVPGAICLEATCGTCGETYNPSQFGEEHFTREDGTECGGSPENEGSWHAEATPTAADTDPEIAAEVAEANGLDDEDAADMIAAATPTLPRGVRLIEFGAAEPSSYVYMLDGMAVATMPSLKIARRPRERKGRNGYVLAGWAVSVDGVEIDRKHSKRDARARLDAWLAAHLAKLAN